MKLNSCRLLVLSVLIGTLGACKRGNDMAPSPAPAQRGALLQSPPQATATYSPTDLLALLGASGLGKTLLQLAYTPACTVTVYHLEYQTVDPAGNLTPASGGLMVPSGSAACQGARSMLLYAHGTSTDRGFNIADLTASNNDEGLLLAAVFAAEGYIVVAPNYLGYDTSTLAYHPYLNADQQSKDMIDALQAARSALPTAQAASTMDGGKLFITGYSEGGYVAMATHRAMQAAGMAVTAAAPLSGPYALSALGDAEFEGRVSLGGPVNLTLLVSGYQHAYGDIYASSADVFAPAYAAGIDTLLPSTTALSQLQSQGKLPPSAVFSSTPPDPSFASFTPATAPANLAAVFAQGFGTDFLIANSYRLSYLQDAQMTPDGGFPTATDGLPPSNPGNALRKALKLNDLRSWVPDAPVLMCGGSSDPTVFFFNTQLMQNYWAANPPATAATVLDVDSAVAAGDPYAALKNGFAAAEVLVRAAAVAGGATDGGDSAVLDDYHAGLVPPFCLSAAKSFFDAH